MAVLLMALFATWSGPFTSVLSYRFSQSAGVDWGDGSGAYDSCPALGVALSAFFWVLWLFSSPRPPHSRTLVRQYVAALASAGQVPLYRLLWQVQLEWESFVPVAVRSVSSWSHNLLKRRTWT